MSSGLPISMDPAEPAAIDLLHNRGLDAQRAINDILPGIQVVSSYRDELTVVQPACEELVNEFGAYRYPDDDDAEKPVDANNHALDSLRYALMTFEQRGAWNVGTAFG